MATRPRPRRADAPAADSAAPVLPQTPEVPTPADDAPADDAPAEPADVLVPESPEPARARVYDVGLRLMQPTVMGDIEVLVHLTAAEIARLLSSQTQWIRLEPPPVHAQHPSGEQRYVNVTNGVAEIIVYGDWTPDTPDR